MLHFNMSLDQKDLELIERIVYKNSDDIAVSIARSFERLEERIDASESRIYMRLNEIDDRSDAARQDIIELLNEFRDEVRELDRVRDLVTA